MKDNISDFIIMHLYLIMNKSSEEAMAPHSSTLAWKIPWTEKPGMLQSMGLLGVRHDWMTSLSLFTFHFHALEKEMATHSSVLAWRIPGTGEPGGLPSMGSHRVEHNWSDLAAAAAWIRISGLFSLVGRGLALQGVSVSTFLNVSLWRCGRMVLFCVWVYLLLTSPPWRQELFLS